MTGDGTSRPPAPRPSAGVGWALWLVFLALATFTQLAFKWGGSELEGLDFGKAWFEALLRSPAVALAVLGYLAMFVVWMVILQRTHLSRAFLMTGLVYITVPAAAWAIFNEKITLWNVVGIACIIAGIALMGGDGDHGGESGH